MNTKLPCVGFYWGIVIYATFTTAILLFEQTNPVLMSSQSAYAAQPRRGNNVSKQNGMNFLTVTTVEINGVELQKFLDKYSELYEFEYFIDRRVDPTTLISGSFTNETFIKVIDDMFQKVNLSYCIVNNSFLYVGPQKAASEALLLFSLKRSQLEDRKEIPRAVADKLNSTIDFSITPYSEAKKAFDDLSKRSHVKFNGFEKTPFDRWRGGSFQNVVVSDLLTIMLLGFNVDYRYDSEKAVIKPTALNRSQRVTRYYPLLYATNINRDNYPKCNFLETSYQNEPVLRVSGQFTDVAEVEYQFSNLRRMEWSEQAKLAQDPNMTRNSLQSRKSSDESSKKNGRFEVSGTIANKQLRDVFAYLKNNSNIVCVLDPSLETLGISQETRISCEFNRSDIHEIAEIIAPKIGAKAEVKGSKIIFSRK